MKIEFTGRNLPQEWIALFASQFNRTVTDNSFEVPASLGKGFIKQFYFFEGLTLTYLFLNLSKSLEIVRKPAQSSDLIPIFFYNQENRLDQSIESNKKAIGYHTENGLFMPSPQIGTSWHIPVGMKDYQLTITVTKDWLLSHVEKEKSYLFGILESGKPFYLFESLTSEMMQVIRTIHELVESDPPFQKASLHLKTMELFLLFLKKAERRSYTGEFSGINQMDVRNAFKVRERILASVPEKIAVSRLAADNGMSQRKLQIIFKQIFGMTISQFALTEKMIRAKDMLESGRYNVSETGYGLGYQNLSHFTQAFRKHFGMNPKQYSQGNIAQ